MAKYHFEAEIIEQEQVLNILAATFSGNASAARAARAIARFIPEMLRRKRGKGFLCATCDREFSARRQPRALLVIYPQFGTVRVMMQALIDAGVPGTVEADAVVTGICERCFDDKVMKDGELYIIEHARKIIPDATYAGSLKPQ
jgi:hypothetical protein